MMTGERRRLLWMKVSRFGGHRGGSSDSAASDEIGEVGELMVI